MDMNKGKNISDHVFLKEIFGGKGFEMKEYEKGSHNYSIPQDNTNILKFDIFPNLQTLTIHGVQSLDKYYSFCLHTFLMVLMKTKIEKVEIRTGYIGYKESDNTSWLSYLWGSNEVSLCKEYRTKGYKIDFYNDGGNNHPHHIFITTQ